MSLRRVAPRMRCRSHPADHQPPPRDPRPSHLPDARVDVLVARVGVLSDGQDVLSDGLWFPRTHAQQREAAPREDRAVVQDHVQDHHPAEQDPRRLRARLQS